MTTTAMPETGIVTPQFQNPNSPTEAIHEYYDRIRNFARRFLSGPHYDMQDAEDIAQETFYRVARHWESYKKTKKFSTWVFTIASNLCKNRLRDDGRRRKHELKEYSIPLENPDDEYANFEAFLGKNGAFDAPDSETDMLHADLGTLVEEAMGRMNPDQREVFRLKIVEGRRYEDIAEVTGVPVGTVKSRLHRAKLIAREYLRQEMPDLKDIYNSNGVMTRVRGD